MKILSIIVGKIGKPILRIWWQYKKTDKEKSFLFLCQLCIKKTNTPDKSYPALKSYSAFLCCLPAAISFRVSSATDYLNLAFKFSASAKPFMLHPIFCTSPYCSIIVSPQPKVWFDRHNCATRWIKPMLTESAPAPTAVFYIGRYPQKIFTTFTS